VVSALWSAALALSTDACADAMLAAVVAALGALVPPEVDEPPAEDLPALPLLEPAPALVPELGWDAPGEDEEAPVEPDCEEPELLGLFPPVAGLVGFAGVVVVDVVDVEVVGVVVVGVVVVVLDPGLYETN
jgi:hypothetical protein